MGISSVSSNLRPGICTSSTRPTTPYEGQVIYETDTDRVLVWDASSWVGVTKNEPVLYSQPVLINGGMEIWQRGTTSANATTTYNTNTSYRADRWFVLPAGATVTQQQSTTVPPNNLSRFSLKVTGATSATTVKIGQRVEAANIPQIRRRVMFAAWIYNETGASFQPELLLGTPSASDNFTTVNNRLTQQLIPCANNEWTEISFTADISGYTDLANGLQVEIQIPSGSLNANTKFVYVTQVRLTPSDYVVPFQRLGVDAELARCQRYYIKSYNLGVAVGTNTTVGLSIFRNDINNAGVFLRFTESFPTRLRTTPTVTIYTSAGTSGSISSFDGTARTHTVSSISNVGEKGFGGFNIGTPNVPDGAEYTYHYIAFSEL